MQMGSYSASPFGTGSFFHSAPFSGWNVPTAQRHALSWQIRLPLCALECVNWHKPFFLGKYLSRAHYAPGVWEVLGIAPRTDPMGPAWPHEYSSQVGSRQWTDNPRNKYVMATYLGWVWRKSQCVTETSLVPGGGLSIGVRSQPHEEQRGEVAFGNIHPQRPNFLKNWPRKAIWDLKKKRNYSSL